MAGYVLNNPESVFSAFTKVTNRFMQGEAYREEEEFLLQGIRTLKIDTQSVKIELLPYDDSTLKVVLEGEIPRFERGPYLNQEAVSEELYITVNEPLASQWISVNVNGEEYAQGTDSKLTAKVYYPSQFKGHIHVMTKDGHVHVKAPEKVPFEIDLASTTGKVSNTVDMSRYEAPADGLVGKITVTTEAGQVSAD